MKEFVMRGQTASGLTHTLNFSGHKGDYGFRLMKFEIYPSKSGSAGFESYELSATITAAKVYEDPINPNFNHEGLIGVAKEVQVDNPSYASGNPYSIVNDTFMITQDLIIAVLDTQAGSPMAVNWQCKFMPVKLSTAEAALTNYRQFSIFDE